MSKRKSSPGTLGAAKPNPKNPRTISDEQLGMLKKSVSEFGDLGSFVFNRRSGQLVSGHQRQKVLPKDAPITILKEFPKPTRNGTVRIGYIEVDGERFSYRETDWDAKTELAANIAANQHGGEFDWRGVTDILKQIDDGKLDLDLLGFDPSQLEMLRQSEWALPRPTPNKAVEVGDGTIYFTMDQMKAVRQAIDAVRENVSEPDMGEGRCIELICVNFMLDPNFNQQPRKS